MAGEGTSNNIDMVDIDLEKDDKKEKEDDDKEKKQDDEKKETALCKATKSPKSSPSSRLLPASLYATAMGRHVIDWSTSDELSQILLEWPGVRLTFIVKATSSISVRLQTSGAVFGYHVLSIHENEDDDNNNHDATSTKTNVVVVEEQVLGGGGLIGRGMKDHVLAKDLDASLVYQVEIWKRNDPGSISRLHGLLVDGQGIKPNKRGQFPPVSNNNPNKNNKNSPTTTKQTATTLHLEFVGDDNTVGFGNLQRKTSIWYYGLCQMTCLPLFSSLHRGTDVTKSWPVYLCRALLQLQQQQQQDDCHTLLFDKVQYSIIACSGVGAKYSLGLESKQNMLNMYPRLLPSDEMSVMKSRQNNSNKTDDGKKKNSKKKKNDNVVSDDDDDDDDDMSLPQPPVHAVLVYLGQNDVASLKDSNTYSELKLTSAWETLLKRIRHRRPLPIPIIVIVPTLDAAVTCCKSEEKRQASCELQNRLWTALVQEKLGGTEQGYFVVPNEHNPATVVLNSKADYGMALHWNADSHYKWARGLEAKIRDIIVQHPPPVPLQQQQEPEQQKERGGVINIKDTTSNINENKRNKNKDTTSRSTKPRDCV